MKKNINNKSYLIIFLIPFFLLSLTCEDKKDSRKNLGSLSIQIKFENQDPDNSAVKIETDPENKDTEKIGDSLKKKLKEDAIKTDSEDSKNHDAEDENEDDSGALKKEKTSLFSSVKYVKITVGELQPVEINVSGSTASTTINDIPVGPQSVSVDLLDKDKMLLYQETKTVTIVAGETATPTFNNFTTTNESLIVLKPNGGESYESGGNVSIEWVGSHDNIPVDIDLYDNNTKSRTIQSSAINNGLKTWNIPASLSPSTTYQIKIASTNNASVSDYSDNNFSVVDLIAPSMPSGLSAIAGYKQVVLAWNANSESDLKSYKVYGGTSANSTTLLYAVNADQETYTHTGLTNGTKYYYRISAVDNSGNESSKSSDVDATPVLPGGGGNGLSFDGSGDVNIASNDDFNFNNMLTIQAWIKPETNGSDSHRRIINRNTTNEAGGWQDRWSFMQSPDDKLQFAVGGSTFNDRSVDGTSVLSMTNWSHVVITFEVGLTKLYINGVEDGRGFTENILYVNAGDLRIGSEYGSSFYTGLIDEVAIWNKHLSFLEIIALYNSGTALDARTNSGDYSSTSNLRGYWKMEDVSGTKMTDISGYGNDGIINGPSWTTGVLSTSYDTTPKIANTGSGVALSFDGSDDYVDVGDDDKFDFGTGDITVQAWINPTSASQNARIVAKGSTGSPGCYQLSIDTDGRLKLNFHNLDILSSSNVIQAETWQHLVFTRSGTEPVRLKGYVNGNQVINYSFSSVYDLTSSQVLEFGKEPGHVSFFNGLIDEVAIWKEGLGRFAVSALYNDGKALDARTNSGYYASSSHLAGYWKMEDAVGTKLTDVSGYGNDGQIEGATWTTGVPSTSYNNNPE